MKLKDIKIGTQIRLAFAIMLCFVILLGALAYIQTDRIHEQTNIMYNHPLQVKTALGELKVDIIAIQRNMRDVIIVKDKNNTLANMQEIDLLEKDGYKQIEILAERYLGNKKDVQDILENYTKWVTIRHEINNLMYEGQFDDAKKHLDLNGDIRMQAAKLLQIVNKINAFEQKRHKHYTKTPILLTIHSIMILLK